MTGFPLEEGDTGEALLPDLLNHDDDAPGQVVQPLLELARNVHTAAEAHRLDAVAQEVRRLQEYEALATEAIQRSGLPEHLAGLKEQIVQLQLDLATANVEHAQTLLELSELQHAGDRKWEAAYWEWGARFGRRKRFWRSGWDHWGLELSVDEYSRRTLVIGPFVIALWACRCDDCKADERELLAVIDAPEEEA